MTLIFAVEGFGYSIIGSDVLKTNYGAINEPQLIPALLGKEVPEYVSGLCKKSVRLTPTNTLLWAGSPVLARFVAKHIQHELQQDQYECLEHSLATCGLSDEELKQIDLIHAIAVHPNAYFETHGDGYEEFSSGITKIAAGTGDWPFFRGPERQSVGDEDLDDLLKITSAIAPNIGSLIFAEGSNQGNLLFGFGGWIDLYMVSPFGFAPFPYLVKNWTWKDGDLFENYPIIWSNYEEFSLQLFNTTNEHGHYCCQVIPDVTDLSQRAPIISEKIYRPAIQIHVVNDPARRGMFIDLQVGNSDATTIKMQKDRATCRSSPAYVNYLKTILKAGREASRIEAYRWRWRELDGELEIYEDAR